MAIITISREFGSKGNEIARLICNKTGYKMFDKSIIAKAALEAGLSAQEIIDYSEDNHKVRSFFDRLFNRKQPLAEIHIWREDADGVRVVDELRLDEDHALSLTKKAIHTAYEMDNVVIVGRGGQVLLKDYPGVLHVRVKAPLEKRIQDLRSDPEFASRSYGVSHEGRREAQDLIEASDAASADYLKRFFNVDWNDISLYHIIFNTAKVAPEQAASTIIDMVENIEPIELPA